MVQQQRRVAMNTNSCGQGFYIKQDNRECPLGVLNVMVTIMILIMKMLICMTLRPPIFGVKAQRLWPFARRAFIKYMVTNERSYDRMKRL